MRSTSAPAYGFQGSFPGPPFSRLSCRRIVRHLGGFVAARVCGSETRAGLPASAFITPALPVRPLPLFCNLTQIFVIRHLAPVYFASHHSTDQTGVPA